MEIIKDIKDTARKVSHSVVDKTQEVTGITKSPSELAKRMVEHLTRGEYHEVAHMLTTEIKKYMNKMDLSEDAFAMKQLQVFEKTADSLADDLEKNNYEGAIAELEKLEKSIPSEMTKNYQVFKAVKSLLHGVIEKLKKHSKEGTEPQFNKLASDFEEAFKQFTDKK